MRRFQKIELDQFMAFEHTLRRPRGCDDDQRTADFGIDDLVPSFGVLHSGTKHRSGFRSDSTFNFDWPCGIDDEITDGDDPVGSLRDRVGQCFPRQIELHDLKVVAAIDGDVRDDSAKFAPERSHIDRNLRGKRNPEAAVAFEDGSRNLLRERKRQTDTGAEPAGIRQYNRNIGKLGIDRFASFRGRNDLIIGIGRRLGHTS